MLKTTKQPEIKNLYEVHKAVIDTDEYIVCLAGATEGAHRWYANLPQLTKHFNVILFNNPGIGNTQSEMLFTVDDLAKRFINALDSLNIEQFYLMGHSMGGFISQRIAIDNPTRVKKVVLIGTSFGSYQLAEDIKSIADVKNTYKTAIEKFPKIKDAVKIQDYSFTKKFQNENLDVIEKYIDEKLNSYKVPKHIAISHFMCGGRFSSFGETHLIVAPTLIIHGTADRMVSIHGGIKLAKTIKDAHILEIEGAGHLPFIEDITLIDKACDFLANGEIYGEVLEKNYLVSQEMLDNDALFREHNISATFKTVIKEIFMLDEIEHKLDHHYEKYKNMFNKIKKVD